MNKNNAHKLWVVHDKVGGFDISGSAYEIMDMVDSVVDAAPPDSAIHYADLMEIERKLDDFREYSAAPVVANYIASRILHFDKSAHRFLEKLAEIDLFDGPLFETNGDVSDNISEGMWS